MICVIEGYIINELRDQVYCVVLCCVVIEFGLSDGTYITHLIVVLSRDKENSAALLCMCKILHSVKVMY